MVGEREARLRAVEVFRGREPPRFVCPLCHEFGCSTAEGLDEHLRETTWHEVNAALQVGYLDVVGVVGIGVGGVGGVGGVDRNGGNMFGCKRHDLFGQSTAVLSDHHSTM